MDKRSAAITSGLAISAPAFIAIIFIPEKFFSCLLAVFAGLFLILPALSNVKASHYRDVPNVKMGFFLFLLFMFLTMLTALQPSKENKIPFKPEPQIIDGKVFIPTNEEEAKELKEKNKNRILDDLSTLIREGRNIQFEIQANDGTHDAELNKKANDWAKKCIDYINQNLGARYYARFMIVESYDKFQGRNETKLAWQFIQVKSIKLESFMKEIGEK